MNEFWKQPIRGFPKTYDPWRDAGDCTFDEATAERVVAYWEKNFTLKDGKFEGQPFVLLPWQKQIVGHLFGWKRADGTRRYRQLFLYIPKKNGKTEFGAGLGLVLLCADGEAGAEVYSCASDTTQAKIVFDAAQKMLEHNRRLGRQVEVFRGYKAFKYSARGAYWKVLSSRADSKHGPNVHGLLIDELHTQRDNELVSTLEAGTISRAQPMVVKMTTAGHTGDTPCNRELDYARGVRDGEIKDPYYLPVIFDGQDADKENSEIWKEEAFWPLVNPSFGVTVQPDYFHREIRKCEVQPSHSEVVKRLHLNIQTDTLSQWLDYEKWKACAVRDPRETGPCYAGLDLSSRTDIGAVELFFTETGYLTSRFYIPKATAESRAEYVLWKNVANIHITEGETIDYRYIRKDINAIAKQYDLQGVAYDPWNATHLVTELADEDEIKMVEFRQGFKTMNNPAKEFERMVIALDICHDNNPVMNWMVRNCAIKTDPHGCIAPVKPGRESPLKVDGVVAAVMATGLAASMKPDESHDSPLVVVL